MVPYFMLALRWPHVAAAGTSLAVIVANATSGVLTFARQKRVDFVVGSALGLATIPGTWLGNIAGERVGGPAFKIAFGILVAVAAWLTVSFRGGGHAGLAWFRRGIRRRFEDAGGGSYDYSVNLWSAVVLSVAIGFLAAFFGVGGGFIHVPMLILLYGLPTHIAMATSQFVLAITAAAGAAGYAWGGHLVWPALLWMGAGAVVGAQIGARTAAKRSGWALRRIFAALMLVVAAVMIWSGLRGGA